MDRKKLNKKLDGIKADMNDTIREEILQDRMKSSVLERTQARIEINNALANLERVETGPANIKRTGQIIATIETMRNTNVDRDWIAFPQTPDEITKIAETRGVAISEVEILLLAVRCEAMLKQVESRREEVMRVLMAGGA